MKSFVYSFICWRTIKRIFIIYDSELRAKHWSCISVGEKSHTLKKNYLFWLFGGSTGGGMVFSEFCLQVHDRWILITFRFSSVSQSCRTLCDSMNCSTPGLSITNSWSLPKPMSIESMMQSNHLILCRPLLFLPSIFPSIRAFSNESALRIRWPKYWSFSFNISPGFSGLISFRMDWLDLLAVKGTRKSPL